MPSLLLVVAVLTSLTVVASTAAADATLQHLRAEADEKGWTFEVGETPISGVADDRLFGLKKPLSYDQTPPRIIPDDDGTLPLHWDWRDWGVVTPIKDQAVPQYCGSCWAHGTVAALESAIALKTGRLLDISEQQLVSCQPDYGSCNGGFFAFGFYEKKGAAYESDFAYTATDARCRADAPQHEKIKSWGKIGGRRGTPTTDEIKRAIYKYGPVAVTVSASGAWKYYKGGVYNECNTNSTNHIVALVGWDDADQVWIMKNSHGTAWGESGYMRIKYTDSRGRKCNNVGQDAAFVEY